MTHLAPLAFFQNFGVWELLIILAIVLLLFAHRLPGLGKALGRTVTEFKSGVKDGKAESTEEEKKDK